MDGPVDRRLTGSLPGLPDRPRLAVYRSLRHVYAQIVDDSKGVTLVSASTLEKDLSGSLKSTGSKDAGTQLGKTIAERAKKEGLESVVFDRGGFSFHGVIKAVADAAREAGLKF